MSYAIWSKGMPDIVCDSYTDINIWEAFFRGMQIDYMLIYPNGNTIEVNFKSNNMTTVEQLDDEIDAIKKQLHHLDKSKSISNKERNELWQYYERRLNSYISSRNAFIENINVETEILNQN